MSSDHSAGRSQSNNYKCVVIGDACVGKTCMVARLTDQVPRLDSYEPTILEDTMKVGNYNGQQYRLEICDTAGQEDYASLRTASYMSVDVFLLCFCLVMRDSFDNLETVWLPELRKHMPNAKVILVGTKLDLYQSQNRQQPGNAAVSRSQIGALRVKYGFEYAECSALSCEGVQAVLEKTLTALLGPETGGNKGKGMGKKKKCSIL